MCISYHRVYRDCSLLRPIFIPKSLGTRNPNPGTYACHRRVCYLPARSKRGSMLTWVYPGRSFRLYRSFWRRKAPPGKTHAGMLPRLLRTGRQHECAILGDSAWRRAVIGCISNENSAKLMRGYQIQCNFWSIDDLWKLCKEYWTALTCKLCVSF